MAWWKHSKFGQLPGDLSRHCKIAMLEGTWRPAHVTPYALQQWRKEHIRRANRRLRHGPLV